MYTWILSGRREPFNREYTPHRAALFAVVTAVTIIAATVMTVIVAAAMTAIVAARPAAIIHLITIIAALPTVIVDVVRGIILPAVVVDVVRGIILPAVVVDVVRGVILSTVVTYRRRRHLIQGRGIL
jgi:hypothetical protein